MEFHASWKFHGHSLFHANRIVHVSPYSMPDTSLGKWVLLHMLLDYSKHSSN